MSALRVVVAGGGVAALEATLALRALAEERIATAVVAPDKEFVYRPLAVTEPFRAGEARRFPLASLVEAAGGMLQPGLVSSVDADAHVVTTREGEQHAYDVLLVALGARARQSVANAVTFAGPESGPELAAVLEQASAGEVRRLVFTVPAGATWPLPLYELALLTHAYLVDRYTTGVEISIVTPEERPLVLFGMQASDAVAELLDARGIDCRVRTTAVAFEDSALLVAPHDQIEADCVVTLPRLEGPRLAGLPFDGDGFIPTDEYSRVISYADVYAAGDATQFPLSQGGIAAQQADVAAEGIAARAGAPVEPTPLRPVLRGLLLTGALSRFLRAEPGTPRSVVDTEPLWWPPAKIVGRHLAPFLAAKLGLSDSFREPDVDAVPVELELESPARAAWTSV
jgi:sulfide:quinone oxidoreductase